MVYHNTLYVVGKTSFPRKIPKNDIIYFNFTKRFGETAQDFSIQMQELLFTGRSIEGARNSAHCISRTLPHCSQHWGKRRQKRNPT